MNKKGEFNPFIVGIFIFVLLISMLILCGINEFYRQKSCDGLGMEFKARNEETFDYCVDKVTGIAYPVIIEEKGWMDYEAQIIQVEKHIVEVKNG